MNRPASRRAAAVLILGFLPITLVLASAAWVQRSKPELSRYHRLILASDLTADEMPAGLDWPRYLALEDAVFAELDARMVHGATAGDAEPAWSRYAPGGINNPSGFPRNWNRSYDLEAPHAVGGALLIHGLTDSPYSLRRAAGILNDAGYHVLGVRLPGHGTVPAELARVDVDDWRATVRLAYRHLQEETGSDRELMLVGYSNGAALALDLVLDSLDDASIRTPQQIVLFSPAIGVTRAAALARAHHLLSWMPWFDRLAWKDIQPEYDPFKYNSFPTDAGYQTHVLTRSVRKRLAEFDRADDGRRLPPVLTFMSLADATVLAEAVVDGLYDHLDDPESELVIFDINRQAQTLGFFKADPAQRLRALTERPTTPYRLTAITNLDGTSERLEEWTRPAGSEHAEVRELDLAWPRGVYSLSHVAVPFPPDDPVYGLEPDPTALFGVRLGTLEPRGERGLLAVPADQITRLRCNPFYSYVEERLVGLTR